METGPIAQFKSHIKGKNADISLYKDRIEWSFTSRILHHKDTQMIPYSRVTSVATRRESMLRTEVIVVAADASVSFVVTKKDAAHYKDVITSMLV